MSNLDDAVVALTQLQSNEQADQAQVQAALTAVQAAQGETTSQADPVSDAIAAAVTPTSTLGVALVAAGWTAPNAGGASTATTTSADVTTTTSTNTLGASV